ncbi:hypothetical protein K488DRAFT_73403 [Vararia minispora EC-137]|uniref:Uncharacterized protein n=1 Tax=Vararia minispora EC-137 TaxID=1314806 RepID=A0ACB8QAS2_9AGAM|nr:hypothetical protein K488DRAFT_73403 [Vararia minispora EC-137]
MRFQLSVSIVALTFAPSAATSDNDRHGVWANFALKLLANQTFWDPLGTEHSIIDGELGTLQWFGFKNDDVDSMLGAFGYSATFKETRVAHLDDLLPAETKAVALMQLEQEPNFYVTILASKIMDADGEANIVAANVTGAEHLKGVFTKAFTINKTWFGLAASWPTPQGREDHGKSGAVLDMTAAVEPYSMVFKVLNGITIGQKTEPLGVG